MVYPQSSMEGQRRQEEGRYFELVLAESEYSVDVIAFVTFVSTNNEEKKKKLLQTTKTR